MSRKVGYVGNGRRQVVQHTGHGKVGVEEHRVMVTRVTFVRPNGQVSVQGAEALRRFLGVMSGHVGQSADGRPAADRGVGAVMIVEVEPAGQGLVALPG